jgi:hypothetical protein
MTFKSPFSGVNTGGRVPISVRSRVPARSLLDATYRQRPATSSFLYDINLIGLTYRVLSIMPQAETEARKEALRAWWIKPG